MSTAKMRHCCVCGAEMGVYESKHYDQNDTCGKSSCEREVRDSARQEREEAHERLDRDRGWGRW